MSISKKYYDKFIEIHLSGNINIMITKNRKVVPAYKKNKLLFHKRDSIWMAIICQYLMSLLLTFLTNTSSVKVIFFN